MLKIPLTTGAGSIGVLGVRSSARICSGPNKKRSGRALLTKADPWVAAEVREHAARQAAGGTRCGCSGYEHSCSRQAFRLTCAAIHLSFTADRTGPDSAAGSIASTTTGMNRPHCYGDQRYLRLRRQSSDSRAMVSATSGQNGGSAPARRQLNHKRSHPTSRGQPNIRHGRQRRATVKGYPSPQNRVSRTCRIAVPARQCTTRDPAPLKWKTRDTVEAIVGAVTGSLQRPELLVVGRYRGRQLEVVGRTVTLKTTRPPRSASC